MAGQSSQLSLKEACVMQHKIQHSGSQANSGKKTSSGDATHHKQK